MRLNFLGTSSGVPTRERNVTALAVGRANRRDWVLVDCGEGTQQQLLRSRLKLSGLSTILVTHMHGDHTFGLPGLLTSASMGGRSETITITGPEPLAGLIGGCIEASESHVTYPITMRDVATVDEQFEAAGFVITTARLSHRVPSFAYVLTEARPPRKLDVEKLRRGGIPQGPAWSRVQAGTDVDLEDGRRIIAEEYLLPPRITRKIVVAGDNDSPDLLAAACEGACLLVHESTYREEDMQKLAGDPMHSSAKRVARFAESVGLPSLILTHFSARYTNDDSASSISRLRDEAASEYSGNLYLAEDFAEFSVDAEGHVRREGQG